MTSFVPGTFLYILVKFCAWHFSLHFLIFTKNENMIYLEKCLECRGDGYKHIDQGVSAD
jgi:hypothetical protein